MKQRRSRTRTLAKRLERAIRVGALITVAVLGLWIISTSSKKVARPFNLYISEASENQRIEQQISELKAENEAMRRRIDYLKTPAGSESEARALGWVREGEVSLVVIPPEEETPKNPR